jgi:hypothetical protein
MVGAGARGVRFPRLVGTGAGRRGRRSRRRVPQRATRAWARRPVQAGASYPALLRDRACSAGARDGAGAAAVPPPEPRLGA